MIDRKTKTCLACGGTAYPLGALGYKVWFRCRDCGLEFYKIKASPKNKEKK